MISEIAKWTVLIFGFYIIGVGFLMLFNPKKANTILRKAGSTTIINYAEITLRLIIAIALILHADASKCPGLFKVFGWFMLVTSLILYGIPRKMHHGFALKSADLIKPIYFQWIAPIAMLLGGIIIYYAL